MSVTAAVLAGLDEIRARQEQLYRDLHKHPELSHHEKETAAKATAWLSELGIEMHDGIGGFGAVGILRNGDGPVVLMRADMDALPVKEQSRVEYESEATAVDDEGTTVPIAHACGHDVHVACLMGAVELLIMGRDQWSGTVIALLQPAEETADGARRMLDDGLAQLIPAPDVAFAQHVLPFAAGTVGVRGGPFLTAADSIRVTVYGRGAHGSMPQASVDPVVLAANIVVRLQTVVSREIDPSETAVLTVGSIQSGSKSNVIPDSAVLQLNIRTYSDETRTAILDAIHRIVDAECMASRSPKPAEFEIFDSFPLTNNDRGVSTRVSGAFAAHFGDRSVPLGRQAASEDFSDVPDAFGAPYTYWGIGGIDADVYNKAAAEGRVSRDIPVNHSPAFAPVIQPTLDTGTEALVVAALAWLAA
ncbi:amidohydrolase [Paramicrobacterium agarici]|uniref:Hippurate hydrolase n=1 Tax=Paramicrobacterium agarici TaxID=630514 RepID=A0A2A9DVK1_9MICO|nr:amidohydrolase [Microbacterium agarici]PFG30361.1 hippurate hydrolase [Microbacterium agarici]